mmetsp:Transcript_28333/g.46044  ORF Transcript_28333/g.46044 Transcript_28333/m.46044 type:complete len:218 (+) Transcript_28333:991-1644(+)
MRRGLPHRLAHVGQFHFRLGVFRLADVDRSVEGARCVAVGGVMRRSTCLVDELDVPFVLGNGLLILAYPREASAPAQHSLHVMRVNSQRRRAFLHGFAVLFQCHETSCSIAVEDSVQTATSILVLQRIVVIRRSIVVDRQAQRIFLRGAFVVSIAEESVPLLLPLHRSAELVLLISKPDNGHIAPTSLVLAVGFDAGARLRRLSVSLFQTQRSQVQG